MIINYQIRNIELTDNKALANIVRETLAEFGANRLYGCDKWMLKEI